MAEKIEMSDELKFIRARRIVLLFKIKDKRLIKFRKEFADLKSLIDKDLEILARYGFLEKKKHRFILTQKGLDEINVPPNKKFTQERVFYSLYPERRKKHGCNR